MSDAGPSFHKDFPLEQDDISCPKCDSESAYPTRILSEDEAKSEGEERSKSQWGGFLAGAAGGALLGGAFGPQGAILGGLFGAVKGSSDAETANAKMRTHVRCDECGYFGDGLGNTL
ncbi:hypothetical protein ACFQFH_05555 [Halobaculum halobium]|uniref:Glycine zipper domain-containing protein n=1 Tax=Halobaculum halobium TaxID=3032281 RepID=A0ABD5T837_9EURY|nr:hypothetical protein [Halobaculum sp. SYNS20]